MIGDVIDTFKNTTAAVKQKFAPKIKLIQVPVTGSHTRKDETSNKSRQVGPFFCPMVKIFAQ